MGRKIYSEFLSFVDVSTKFHSRFLNISMKLKLIPNRISFKYNEIAPCFWRFVLCLYDIYATNLVFPCFRGFINTNPRGIWIRITRQKLWKWFFTCIQILLGFLLIKSLKKKKKNVLETKTFLNCNRKWRLKICF